MSYKSALRINCRQSLKRLATDTESWLKKTKQAINILTKCQEFIEGQHIGIYKALVDEFNLTELMLDHPEKHFYLPVCIENYGLKFIKLAELNKLQNSYSPIKIFSSADLESAKVESFDQKLDTVIVPALGYTNSGYRLGRGAGYYDRYINYHRKTLASNCKFLGLVYSDLVINDDSFIESHDAAVDKLLIV
jgi:5-formyltetrahydrofolate cyclo-ligase